MPVKVIWDTADETRLRVEFEEPWNWADCDQAMNIVGMMLNSVPQKVDVVSNLFPSRRPPLNVSRWQPEPDEAWLSDSRG
jgi:hypothetical protein